MDLTTRQFLKVLFGTIGTLGAIGAVGYASYLDAKYNAQNATLQAERNRKFTEDVSARLAELDQAFKTAPEDKKPLFKDEIARLVEVQENNNQSNFTTLNHLFDKVVNSDSVVEAIKANKEREELINHTVVAEPEVIHYINDWDREDIYEEIEEVNQKIRQSYGQERELLTKVRENLYKKLM
jgi:hypothetical protein